MAKQDVATSLLRELIRRNEFHYGAGYRIDDAMIPHKLRVNEWDAIFKDWERAGFVTSGRDLSNKADPDALFNGQYAVVMQVTHTAIRYIETLDAEKKTGALTSNNLKWFYVLLAFSAVSAIAGIIEVFNTPLINNTRPVLPPIHIEVPISTLIYLPPDTTTTAVSNQKHSTMSREQVRSTTPIVSRKKAYRVAKAKVDTVIFIHRFAQDTLKTVP